MTDDIAAEARATLERIKQRLAHTRLTRTQAHELHTKLAAIRQQLERAAINPRHLEPDHHEDGFDPSTLYEVRPPRYATIHEQRRNGSTAS